MAVARREAVKGSVHRLFPTGTGAAPPRGVLRRLPADLDVMKLITEARAAFFKDPNVIGVGVGERRKGGETRHGEMTLVVYVRNKLSKVASEYLIPSQFQGIPTDVMAPFGADAPMEALGFSESHQHAEDMGFIDWARLSEQGGGDTVAFHGKVQDFGDVCAIEDDGTLVQTINGQQVVDFARAYKLFRTTHPDIYDFVTFFTDTASGMPPQGGSSWYSFVHNDTQGIGLGSFNNRAAFGTNKLQGIMFLNQGHFPIWRYVMLQEQGHRWGSFARYRDTAAGALMNDHMLGGWGHWDANFDDDKSPMDYDIYDWVASGNNFNRVALASDERIYCNLDLYLMGLLGADEVGDFYLLSNVTPVSGNTYSANKKLLNIHNILWAEGNRVPNAAVSQKLFKNGFIVLTKSHAKVHDLVDRVDDLRLRFERDFYQASKLIGRVDTTLGPLRTELTASQIQQLTSGGYTALHRHLVGFDDLRVTGTQFSGTLQPNQTQNWFTHSWPAHWHVNWVVVPTTVAGGGPKIEWSVRTERPAANFITYWITIRNVTAQPLSFEARYAILR